jgi:hypothetical protein
MFLRQKVCEPLCLLVILLFVAVGLILVQSQRSSDADCPKVVSARSISLAYSLYYVRYPEYVENVDEIRLWVFRDGTSQRIDELTAPYGLRISPDGSRLLHFAVPASAEDVAHGDGIYIVNLPMLVSNSISSVKRISYLDEWPPFRGGVGWTDPQNIYFRVMENEIFETIVLNVDDTTYRAIPWPQLSDLWQAPVWGGGIFNSDLSYFLYPSSSIYEGTPNPRTGEAMLRLVALSNPDTSYDLVPGYAGTVKWQRGSNSFIFEGGDYVWYRVNADEVVTGDPLLYSGRGLSVFHEGVWARLSLPSLSPDGHHLTALAYLPNEQLYTLLMLSEGSDLPVDLCLHGDYMGQVLDTDQVGAVWSPDSRYFAFAIYAGAQTGLYVYDVQNHTLGLVDALEDTKLVEVVGWGR